MNILYRLPLLFCFVLLFIRTGVAQTIPPAATVKTKITVPQSMKSGPFNTDRYALIPENFSISVYARIGGARFMAIAPNGDLLVSDPGAGRVRLVRPNGTSDPVVSDFVTGLQRPHDIVFHKIDATTYVYISEKNQVNRYKYVNGDLTGHDREIVVTGLPDASLPELHGSYGHELKNIALDINHKLYISIASTCNACLEDTKSDPLRGAIYQYDADGKNRKFFARGLRNAEGLAFIPGTNDLWAIVNNRDNIAYPYDDATGNYGKVITSFVDNNPPEEFTKVVEGGNYGWPFCNPDPRGGMDNMPFDRDYEFNKNGAVDCSTMQRISKGIQAHSAPLGFIFTQNTAMPASYRSGAVAALHGSWNRAKKTGYKVIFFPWDSETQLPGEQISLVDGFLGSDSSDNSSTLFARPVDVAVDLQGNLLISDDYSGTIFKLSYQTVTSTTQAQLENTTEVHPVPADKKITISMNPHTSGNVLFTISNSNGVDILHTSHTVAAGNNEVSLETGTLASGMYFLTIATGSDKLMRKLIVQH